MPELDPACVILSPVVSWVVDFLKRVPFLRRYPKVAAFVIGAALAYVRPLVLGGPAATAQAILVCALTILAGAVATHEVVTTPAAAMLRRGGSA